MLIVPLTKILLPPTSIYLLLSIPLFLAACGGGGGAGDGSNQSPVEQENSPPTNISLSSTSVQEEKPAGTVVGTLSTTDSDAGDSHTYTLVSGDIGAFTISGDQLRTSQQFDFVSKNSYTIRVRSTDEGGKSFEKQFTIAVTDKNNPPVASNVSASTNQAVAIKINISASDTDGTVNLATVRIVASPTNGSAVPNGDGTITYTPNPNGNPVTVMLARIIDRNPTEPDVTTFNNNVANGAGARISAGDDIVIVDQFSALRNGAGPDPALYNGNEAPPVLHPSQAGYEKMGDTWFDALTDPATKPSILDKCP